MDEMNKMSLADLGVEDTTPADIAANNADSQPHVETIKPMKKQADASSIESTPVTETKGIKQDLIVKPQTADGSTNYGETITDINSIAVNPIKQKEDPVRKTLDGFYDLADKGIERTKREMLAPGGRIDEAKRKYVNDKYDKLVKRAKASKSLAAHIKAINEAIQTDPRFDGITDYERRAYILFTVTRDNSTGINNEYFGIKEEARHSGPRLSSDANKEIDTYTSTDDSFLYNDDSKVVLGDESSVVAPMRDKVKKEEKVSVSNLEMKQDDDDILDDDDIDLIGNDEDTEEKPTTKTKLTEEQISVIRKEYRNQCIKELNLNKSDDLEGYSIATKPIKLNAALVAKNLDQVGITWGLQHSGMAIEMSPFSGEEIMTLSPENTDFATVAGLRTVFSTIYHHIKNQNKPPFEVWIKQVSDYDVDNLLFAIHTANFKDINYITYECPNPKCNKVFLEKKPIEEMVIYPNDEVKERFAKILAKDTVDSQMYRSKPKFINENYAIGFATQSIYSNMFERAALDDNFSKKYASAISIMPSIDKIYRIDKINKTLIPISFGVVEDDLTKTVMRKAKAINTIMKTFTPDERAIVVTEAAKIANEFREEAIKYAIPATECPTCGEPIIRVISNPLSILFTRARLPIEAAFIQE